MAARAAVLYVCERKIEAFYKYYKVKWNKVQFKNKYRLLYGLELVTVHAYVPSNGICRGFAFKYGKFLLPPRFLTALSVPKVPTRVQ